MVLPYQAESLCRTFQSLDISTLDDLDDEELTELKDLLLAEENESVAKRYPSANAGIELF